MVSITKQDHPVWSGTRITTNEPATSHTDLGTCSTILGSHHSRIQATPVLIFAPAPLRIRNTGTPPHPHWPCQPLPSADPAVSSNQLGLASIRLTHRSLLIALQSLSLTAILPQPHLSSATVRSFPISYGTCSAIITAKACCTLCVRIIHSLSVYVPLVAGAPELHALLSRALRPVSITEAACDATTVLDYAAYAV